MRFALGPFPVQVELSFLFMGAMLAYSRRDQPILLAAWVAVAFVSILIHELGHAAAFHRFGHRSSIRLYAMGGMTRSLGGPPLSASRSMFVSLAGPAASISIGGLVLVASGALPPELPSLVHVMLRDAVWINLGWSLFNLLPMWPLDGGQALHGFLRVVAPRRAHLTYVVSLLTIGGFLAFALADRNLWGAFLCMWFGSASLRELRRVWGLGEDAPLDLELTEGYDKVRAGDIEDARVLAERIIASAKTELMRTKAVELLAWTRLSSKDGAGALELLERLPEDHDPDPDLLGRARLFVGAASSAVEPLARAFRTSPSTYSLHGLLMALIEAGDLSRAKEVVEGPNAHFLDDHAHAHVESALYHAERFEEAFIVCKLRHDRFRSGPGAYNAACALVRLERHDEAIEWLLRAKKAGFDGDMMGDEDLAPLRGREDFRRMVG